MSINWINPYQDVQGEWHRGSLHGHCRPYSGCASLPLDEEIPGYIELGARFIAVTDHDHVTDLSAARAAYPEILFLQGFEHSRTEHMVFVGENVPPLHELSLPEAMAHANGLLTLASHPDQRPGQPYWTRAKLLALGRLPDGIEVYNGHYGIERLRVRGHAPRYTHLWDELLTAGLRLWGFANDDLHDLADLGNAFNMVLARERTPAAIVAAAKRGAFYGSTGLTLAEVAGEGGHLRVTLDEPCTGRFVGPQGKTLAEGSGVRFEYTATDEPYVRFEAEGASGLLFLQPVCRTSFAHFPSR